VIKPPMSARAAPMSASLCDNPARHCTLVKSTTRMAFLVTRPISRISPIRDMMFRVSLTR